MFDLAYADAAAAQAAPNPMGTIIMFGLMFVILYFLVIRPQKKRAKEHQEMLQALQREDQIVTQGGVYGKITGITDQQLTIEIADNVRVKIDRQYVARKIGGDDKAK